MNRINTQSALSGANTMEAPGNELLSKVPEVTIYFWIIKVLCTTVGETASDFLNVNLAFGLTGTSIAMGVLLLVVLFVQFSARKYVASIYWTAVVLISIVGTLITDNLTDGMGVPLIASTAAFSVALAITFVVWYVKERTLSIHSIFTRRRESFYWLAILFTFALGTAAGDLMAEKLGFGYLVTGLLICAAIIAVAVAWHRGVNAVLAFWIAYILTRPLGASFGDYLSQAPVNGGLGLGTSITSAIFLFAILAVVLFLAITKRDLIQGSPTMVIAKEQRVAVIWQIATVAAVIAFAAGTGFYWRSAQLRDQAIASVSSTSPLGDLSVFRRIAEDTLDLVRAGKMAAAKSRVGDLETAWDNAQAKLKPMNPQIWSYVDKAIDDVLRDLRASRQDPAACSTSLGVLLDRINH